MDSNTQVFDQVLRRNQEATELMKAGQHPQALTLLHQAERLFPHNSTGKALQLRRVVCNNLGCCYMKSKQLLLAAKYLRKALEVTGDSEQEIGTRLNLSSVYFQLNEHNLALVEALKSLHILETRAPGLKEDRVYVKVLHSAGMAYEALGQRRKALLHYFKGQCAAEERLGLRHELTQTLKSKYEGLVGKGMWMEYGLQPECKFNPTARPLFTKISRPTASHKNGKSGHPIPSLRPLRSPEPLKHSSSTPKHHSRQRISPSTLLSSTAASSKDFSLTRINRNTLVSPQARKQRSLRARAPSESCIKPTCKSSSSDMELRIHSIDEKLQGLTQRLSDYGRKNSIVKEIAARAATVPSGITTPGSEQGPEACSAVMIQRHIRGFLARKRVQGMQKKQHLTRSRTAQDGLKTRKLVRSKRSLLRHSITKPIVL